MTAATMTDGQRVQKEPRMPIVGQKEASIMRPFVESCRRVLPSMAVLLGLGVSAVCAQVFRAVTVDEADDVGKYTCIALDQGNSPHISYYDETNEDLKYAKRSGGTWNSATVDEPGDVGLYTSIVVDDLGNPYISYYYETNGMLKLAYTETSGGPWRKELGPDARLGACKATSIALSHAYTNPIIAYFDDNTRELKLAMYDCAHELPDVTDTQHWSKRQEVVTASNTWMEDVSLVLGSGSEPHIAFIDLNGTDADLEYANKECSSSDCLNSATELQPTGQGTWNCEVADPSGAMGQSADIALDANENPHISYYNWGLKYATRSGGTWIIENVDNTGDVGQYSSIAIDANNNPHISYYDATRGALKYATRRDGTWSKITVDDEGSVGLHTSIALDGDNHPHISYYDATNGDLKYAYISKATLVPATKYIDYGEVEVGYRFRQAVKIRNCGDIALRFRASIVPGPNDGQFITSGLSDQEYVVQAGESTYIEIAFAPTEETASEIGLTLRINTTNDEDWQALPDENQLVHLHGRGVPALPLSTMLVIDRSLSMSAYAGEVKKIEAARDAGQLYAGILNDDFDWLGITRYNEDSLTVLVLEGIAENRTTSLGLLGEIWPGGRLEPQGSTGIGRGMLAGSHQFDNSPAENAQAMIVLTDGKENVFDPGIEEAKREIRDSHDELHIFCVGIGDPIETGAYGLEGVETSNLELVAEETNALFRVIQALSGDNRYALEAFYFKVFATAKGHQIVLDPAYNVALADHTQEIASVSIAECDREADFAIISELLADPEYKLLIQLQDPTGQIIDPTSNVGGVGVHVRELGHARLVRVKFPPRTLSDSYSGTWKLLLQPVQKKSGSNDNEVDKVTAIPSGGGKVLAEVPKWSKIAFMAAVGSDYRLDASVTEGQVFVNQPIHLGAVLTEAWWPAPNGAVSVAVTKPDGSVDQVNLFDDGFHGDGEAGDGEFGLDYVDTGEKGYHEFYFRGTGRTERGETVTREQHRAKYVCGHEPEKAPPLRQLRRLLASFHVGATYPLGDLDSLADSNIHVRADATYVLADRVQVVAMVGLSQFTAEWTSAIAHPRWVSASLNLKALFPAPTGTGLRYYLQGGPGYYSPKTGSNEVGFNVGAGAQVPIASPFSLEFGADFHRTLTKEHAGFLTFQLGVLFR